MIVNTRTQHETTEEAHTRAMQLVDPNDIMWHEVELGRAIANDNRVMAYAFANTVSA